MRAAGKAVQANVRRSSRRLATTAPLDPIALEDPERKPKRAKTAKASAASVPSDHLIMQNMELSLTAKGFKRIVGVDEAGRGPLAGPVVAAACYVPLDLYAKDPSARGWMDKVADSKVLSEAQREEIYMALTAEPRILWAAHTIDAKQIDQINILQCSMLAMHHAVSSVKPAPDHAVIDGNRSPWGHPEAVRANGTVRAADPEPPAGLRENEPVIKGDAKVFCVACASVIAKVTRDRLMVKYDKEFPAYGFAQHKGYGTAAHMSAIHKLGPCPIHRLTFAPLKTSKWGIDNSSTAAKKKAVAPAAKKKTVAPAAKKKTVAPAAKKGKAKRQGRK
jgi:ribonuclease HII